MSPARQTGTGWMKFEPSINTGQIVQVAVLLVTVTLAYSKIQHQGEMQAKDVSNVRAELVTETGRAKEAITEIRAEQKEQTRLLNALTTDIALLRGRAAETGMTKK